MKKLLLSILFVLLLAAQGWGAIYYVDNTCPDTNPASATVDGTAYDPVALTCTGGSASYYVSIADVNLKAFAAGDSILFRKGQTWREQLTVPSSGSAGSLITFGAYGSGVAPVINGSDLMTTWTTVASWQTAITQTNNIDIVYGIQDFRSVLATNLGSVSGTKIRLTLEAQAGGNATLNGTSIGVSTTNDDFDSTPTRITWDVGSSSTTITAGTTKTSDEITFTFTKTNRHLVHFYASAGFVTSKLRGITGAGEYEGTTGDDTMVQTVSYAGPYNERPFKTLEVYVTTPNVYQKSGVTTEPNQIFFDGTLGTKVASVALVNGANKWYWASNVLYVYSTADPDTVYTNPGIEASQRDYGILSDSKSYFIIDNLSLKKANGKGIHLIETLSNFTIQNSDISYNYLHGIGSYGNGGWQTNGLITNNTISYNGVMGIFVEAADTWTISHNTIHHQSISPIPPSWGFGGGIYSLGTANPSKNMTIEYNNVYSNGTSEVTNGIWIDTAGTGSIVRYNIVHDNSTNGIVVERTNQTSVYYNIVYNHTATYASGILLTGYAGSTINNNTVYNNVSYNNFNGIDVNGADVTNGTNNNLIKNNISLGSLNVALRCMGGGENDGTYGSGNVYIYNAFGPQATEFIKWGASWYSTYATWETAYGDTTHSVQSDPLFVSTSDFHLQPTSPAINAGVDVGLTSDYEGYKVPRGSVPTIGAYERFQQSFLRPGNFLLKPKYILK